MLLPEADRLRLIEMHRRLDRRRAVLLAVLLVVFVLPAAIAVTLAAMRPDPESAVWFWGGVVWAGVGGVFVVRDVRRWRWVIHDETPGVKLRARPRGLVDRLLAAGGGLAVIGFGLLLWHFALGAMAAVEHGPARRPWFCRSWPLV